jgi:hypothetical protein
LPPGFLGLLLIAVFIGGIANILCALLHRH